MSLKTQPTNASVTDFLQSIPDDAKRRDCIRLRKLMEEITGAEAVMWGDSIVGFGSFHYEYSSGRQGDWFLTGFSPRKQNISVYIMNGFDNYEHLIDRIGKVKTSVSCLYLKRLSDLKEDILEEMLRDSVRRLRQDY